MVKEQQIRNWDLQGIADLIDRRLLGKRTVQFDLAKRIHRNFAFFRQLFLSHSFFFPKYLTAVPNLYYNNLSMSSPTSRSNFLNTSLATPTIFEKAIKKPV